MQVDKVGALIGLLVVASNSAIASGLTTHQASSMEEIIVSAPYPAGLILEGITAPARQPARVEIKYEPTKIAKQSIEIAARPELLLPQLQPRLHWKP